MIKLHRGDFGTFELENTEKKQETILIQTDWDWPSVAMTFGWTPCTCDDSGSTDGTVDCKCGRTSSEMIGMAGYWLDEHIGGIVEDPGYFLQEIV